MCCFSGKIRLCHADTSQEMSDLVFLGNYKKKKKKRKTQKQEGHMAQGCLPELKIACGSDVVMA